MPRRNRVPESVSMETPKARKAEERRRREIEDRRRIEERPSVLAKTSEPITTTRAEYRDLMSRGGQGDPDEMLGMRMNPLLEAPMFAGGLPSTILQTLTASGLAIGTMYGIEKLAESRPRAAALAQLALAAIAVPGMAKKARTTMANALNDIVSEPTGAKLDLLYAMLRKHANDKSAPQNPQRTAVTEGLQRLLEPPTTRRELDWEGPHGLRARLGRGDVRGQSVEPQAPVPASQASQPQQPVPSPQALQPHQSALTPKVTIPLTNPVKTAMDLPSEATIGNWIRRVARTFGDDIADRLYDLAAIPSKRDLFRSFLYGATPEQKAEAARLYKRYETQRALYDKIAEPGQVLLGGSSSIGSEGTIVRNEIGHDLDFQAQIANASKRTDIGTPGATAAMVSALRNRANIENAPIIQKLRKLYPQLADAKFRYADRKFQWWGDEKYQPDMFTVAIPEPTVTPTGEANVMVNVLLDGQKVDLMLTDSALLPSKGNPRLARAETALHWKSAYVENAGKDGKPLTTGQRKHLADLARYREYSEDNRRIDTRSGRTQFAPFDFPENRLIDSDGLPVVGLMETVPGSGRRVPVIMNAWGRILPLDDPNMLYTWYSKWHPQNNPRYANPTATKDTHPLVAIRGAERFIRAPRGASTEVDHRPGMGLQGGEPAPGIGIYPAANPELLADEIIKGGRWSTYRSGKHKDMIFYPREAVDPQADSGNVLHAEDAYWDNPYAFRAEDPRTGFKVDPVTPAEVDALGQRFGDTIGVPAGQYTEIGNAFRNRLYEVNPEGHFNAPPGQGEYMGYGEARHLGRAPDGTVIPGELIDTDPEKARGMIIDLIKKGMFLVPAAASIDSDEETQQDAKGGNTRSDAKGGEEDRFATSRNFLATDKVPNSIFGYPIASRREDYTPEDIEFFRAHPEAGGYYDLGGSPTPASWGAEEAGDAAPIGVRDILATDKVPDTLFGFRVVSRKEDYTPADLAFFREHPEAGGYYDLGEVPGGGNAMQGTVGGGDSGARGRYPGVSNNPGNVEKHERRKNKTLFAGEIAGGVRPKRFASFRDPVSGLNATAVVLARRAAELEKSGKRFTIANYAPIYAPETENDTENYIKNLSRYSGIDRDAVLDLHEDETMAKLLRTVVRFESGAPHSEWFTDAEYRNAVELMKKGAYE